MSNVPDGAQLSPDGNYWWDGNQWQPVEQGESTSSDPVTIPETTIVGDPNQSVDPNSADDAYAAGYMAGSNGKQYYDSAFADGVKANYQQGYNEGAAQRVITPQPSESSGGKVVEGTAELVGPSVLTKAIEIAFDASTPPLLDLLALATSPGGDTALQPPVVYMGGCLYQSHGPSGFGDGFWHGTPTLDYNDANNEKSSHGNDWAHTDGVLVFQYMQGTWDTV